MRLLVASDKDTVAEYLQGVGYEVRNLYSNDLAIKAIKEFNIDVIVYFTSVQTTITHEQCIRELKELGKRVLLITDDIDLLNYAAALGITDIMMYPVKAEDVLHCIRNPATSTDVAELILKFKRSKEKASGDSNKVDSSIDKRKLMVPLDGVKVNGKLTAVLGTSNIILEDWIKANFCDDIEVIASIADSEDLKQKIIDCRPHICVLVRQGQLGGIAAVEEMVLWSADKVPAIFFIAGVLDEQGIKMTDRARQAGVNYIVSCEKGGEIYGGEMVYALSNIIKELQQIEESTSDDYVKNTESRSTLSSLFQGASILGKAIKNSADIATEKTKINIAKKTNPRINKREGISLEEPTENLIYNGNLKNPTSIMPGGILAVVSPWRPNLAGRLSAHAVKMFAEIEGCEVAYIGASGHSTGAMWMDLPEEVLMMSDWRVPGSNNPIVQDNLRIYAVDPIKNLHPGLESDLWNLLKQARKTATYTVVDCAADISIAQKVTHQGRSVLLMILPGNDPVELKVSSLWTKNIMDGKQNVVTGIDLRGVPSGIPEGIKPKVVIRNNPADALTMALRKTNEDDFIWN